MAITKLESSRDFFRIWFFWKKQAVFVFFLIVGVVMFYAYAATPIFQSKAEILILPKTNEGQVISSGGDEKKVIPVSIKDIFNETELLASDDVLRSAVKSLGVEGLSLTKKKKGLIKLIATPFKAVLHAGLSILRLTSPPASQIESEISKLKDYLDIEPVVDSDMIRVSLKGERPERITDVLNIVLSSYMKHRNNVFTKEEGLQFYDDQAYTYKAKLAEAEKQLKEFQRAGNIVNLGMQNRDNITLLMKLNNDLKLLEISYEEGVSKMRLLKQNIQETPGELHLTKEMRKIPAIMELEKGIVPILIKRSEISKIFTKPSREFKSINGQVKMLRDEIRYEINKAISTDMLELSSMKIKIEALKNQITSLKTEANDLNQQDKTHKELVRQVELFKNSYVLYSNKTEDAKIYSQKAHRDLANVSITSQPTTPERPIFPKRLLMLMLSTVFGAFTALCTPFVLESIDNKIKTSDDVEQIIGLPVICSFPEISTCK